MPGDEGVIRTPEDETLRWWLDMEATHLHGGVAITTPTPEPHPNEVATREAVDNGVYAAEDVGVEGS